MSVRDDPVLFLQQGKARGGGGGTVGGGSAVTTTRVHKLDGPEHAAADDSTRLDASVDEHGLMPKLSGHVLEVLRGDGTWGAAAGGMVPYFIASGNTFTVPEFSQALYAMTIDNEGILDVVGFLLEVD